MYVASVRVEIQQEAAVLVAWEEKKEKGSAGSAIAEEERAGRLAG